jgi:hypothetical protein
MNFIPPWFKTALIQNYNKKMQKASFSPIGFFRLWVRRCLPPFNPRNGEGQLNNFGTIIHRPQVTLSGTQ